MGPDAPSFQARNAADEKVTRNAFLFALYLICIESLLQGPPRLRGRFRRQCAQKFSDPMNNGSLTNPVFRHETQRMKKSPETLFCLHTS